MKPMQRIATLIIKELEGTLDDSERHELNTWLEASSENRSLYASFRDETMRDQLLQEHGEDKQATLAKILERAPELQETPVRSFNWKRLAVAASILIVAGIGVWRVYESKKPLATDIVQSTDGHYKNDVAAPTRNSATLTLASGQVIDLADVEQGSLAQEGNTAVMKKENSVLEYSPSGSATGTSVTAYNTAATGTGSSIKIVLSDKSIVWLNASSSLKYPISFNEADRIVELTGEAYFEVAKSPLPASPGGGGGKQPRKWPFHVKVDGMEVEVLGTHFNVRSYAGDEKMKTTLLEGSVRVTPVVNQQLVKESSKLLVPGQQATLGVSKQEQAIQVRESDTEEAVAWVNNQFMYSNMSISALMKELERWYGISVEWAGPQPTDQFSIVGVSKKVPLSTLLNILTLTDKVKFEIDGKKVTVSKK